MLDMRSLEAIIGKDGQVRLLEPIESGEERRAIVVVFDETFEEAAVLSEGALEDWNRPEEDSAWSHLQPAK